MKIVSNDNVVLKVVNDHHIVHMVHPVLSLEGRISG